jgi:predicted nucleotidyltransferase
MTDTSLDLSNQIDLRPLAQIVRALQAAAQPAGVDFFLIGAAARDLMLQYAHNIAPQRQTEDVDFAVMVNDWAAFAKLRDTLIANGEFSTDTKAALHQLRHKTGLPLDIVPFGNIERPDRTIAWPPDQSIVLDCFGAREAFNASVLILLPDAIAAQVATIPALTLLKISAWHDRKYTHAGKDAADLTLYLRSYMDCGTLDRAARDHGDLFTAGGYDHEVAGARLLGRDVALLLDKKAVLRAVQILAPQADAQGQLLMASQSGMDLERSRRLIEAFCDELALAL